MAQAAKYLPEPRDYAAAAVEGKTYVSVTVSTTRRMSRIPCLSSIGVIMKLAGE